MIALARLLRVVAIAIAILGVVDPVFTWPRTDRPVVSIIDAGDAGATTAIASGLSRNFEVHRGAIASAVSTVLVGHAVPAPPPAVSGSVIAATPDPLMRHVAIDDVRVPSIALPGSAVPVGVTLRSHGAKGRKLRIDVSFAGVLLDRATTTVAADDEVSEVALSATALTAGLAALTVRVADDASDDALLKAEAVVAMDVVSAQWRVLVADARPSWMSTFVRRALEADRRFAVTSRVSTSRGIGAEVGSAPALIDAAALESYSAIVLGAPDALTADEAAALEGFARNRGGAVVLLMDRIDGGAFSRLVGASMWRDVHGIERRALTAPSGGMQATELAVPQGLIAGAEVLSSTADKSSLPVVWQAPLGAGRVVVSGALDAWRYRTRDGAGFSRFWTQALADVASAAPAAVALLPSARVVSPGTSIEVRAVVRSAQLSDPSRPAPVVEVRAMIGVSGGTASDTVRLWPTPERGVFAATMRVPDAANTYRIIVEASSGDGRAIGTASADVLGGETRALNARQDLAAWVASQGGVVLPSADAMTVERAVRDRLSASSLPRRVHPMRSLWWLPVFIAALGGEWWLRRRRGDR